MLAVAEDGRAMLAVAHRAGLQKRDRARKSSIMPRISKSAQKISEL